MIESRRGGFEPPVLATTLIIAASSSVGVNSTTSVSAKSSGVVV